MSMPNLKCELINHIQKVESDGIQFCSSFTYVHMVIGVLHPLQDGISLAPTSWKLSEESRFVGSGESTGNTFHKPPFKNKGKSYSEKA